MPGKNKPKRLDRQRSWRVARRKKKRAELASGVTRSRPKRPKNKGRAPKEAPEEQVKAHGQTRAKATRKTKTKE